MSRGRKPATGKARQARDSAATARQQHAADPGAASGQDSLAFGFGTQRRYLDRAIYTTITIMSVLNVYDGWQHLKLWAAAGDSRPGARHVRLTRLLGVPGPASRAARAPRPPRADDRLPGQLNPQKQPAASTQIRAQNPGPSQQAPLSRGNLTS